MIDNYWKNNLVDVRRLGNKMIALKFVGKCDTFNVYALQVRLEVDQKIKL